MKKYFLTLLYILSFFCGGIIYSQNTAPITGEYTVLAPVPGTTKTCTGSGSTEKCTADINSYLNGFLGVVISIGAIIAMLYIAYYGFRYAISDSASVKMENKGKLWEIIQGLLLIISAYAIIYTINPDFVDFSLEITSPKSVSPVTTTSTGVTTGGGVFTSGKTGCQTNCVYQYTNSSGSVIAYKNCFECNAATSYGLDIKPPTTIDGKNVLINRDLGTRLAAIQMESNKLGTQPQFQITETWPPTVNHIEQGQYDGTSVDLAFKSTPTAKQINTFIEIASRNGIRAQYEVTNEAARQELIKQGVPAANILSVGHATGGHFSIYKK